MRIDCLFIKEVGKLFELEKKNLGLYEYGIYINFVIVGIELRCGLFLSKL